MTQLRVLIDATQITKDKAGVGTYGINLIRELASLGAPVHLFVLAQDDDPSLDFGVYSHVTMIWVRSSLFRRLPFRFLLEQLGIPFLTYKHKINVVHSLHYTFPLISLKAKKIVTFHDMTFILMPEVHEPFKVTYFTFFIHAALRRVDSIIFVSASALADFQAHLGTPRGLKRVVSHGKSEACRPDFDSSLTDGVKRKYGLPPHFILFIGTVEPRKNITRLVEAFEFILIKRPDIALVIVGQQGWMCDSLFKTIRSLNMDARVIFVGYCPEEDKALLLAAATIFAYPSLYEGFGIPVLEALASGIPTVTSNVSAMPEVAGCAALMVNPNSTSQLAIALERLLTDPELRKELREQSLRQAAKFTWQRAATETLDAYKEVSSNEAERSAA
jgi:glycosyltransferase involved in cell wall biosynthesis